jgi:hypothetical protein
MSMFGCWSLEFVPEENDEGDPHMFALCLSFLSFA